jgi:hypothetical protein
MLLHARKRYELPTAWFCRLTFRRCGQNGGFLHDQDLRTLAGGLHLLRTNDAGRASEHGSPMVLAALYQRLFSAYATMRLTVTLQTSKRRLASVAAL